MNVHGLKTAVAREITRLAQMIARAMTRKGNALQKKGDLEGAVAAYSKVLMFCAHLRVVRN